MRQGLWNRLSVCLHAVHEHGVKPEELLGSSQRLDIMQNAAMIPRMVDDATCQRLCSAAEGDFSARMGADDNSAWRLMEEVPQVIRWGTKNQHGCWWIFYD